MKLLWIDLNCSYAHSSLALPAIHAQMADRTDVEWAVVSTTTAENVGTVVDAICEQQPDVVAASTWLFTHEYLLHIVGRLKALMPRLVVILGGPEFLDDNERYLRIHPEVDVVLRGEGEESMPQWLTVWNRREEWRTIPGLCYVEGDEYVDNGLARVMDFASLVSPEESRFFCWSKPFVQLETTRGCFNTCAFCVSGIGDPVRSISMEAIRQRLDRIREHHIRDVRVLDRTFNYNQKWAVALLELFESYYPDLHFHLEIHPALLPDKVREVIKRLPAGLLHLEAGMQSLRQPVLDVCRRKGTLEKGLEGLQYLCALPNVVAHADLIAGLPLYHLEEIFEDIRTLASFRAGEIQLESLKLLPGTYMRRNARELGIRFSPLPPYEVLATDAITTDELQVARRLSRLLDMYYNTAAWQEVTRSLILEQEDFLHRFLEHLTVHNYIDQPMSLEHRGELLYTYCKEHYPAYTDAVTMAWIEAGFSLKKRPAERVRTAHLHMPETYTSLMGTYADTLRLAYLPMDNGSTTTSSTEVEDGTKGYWYGYDSTRQQMKPAFKAVVA